MIKRLVKCIKAWGVGIAVMGLPVVFLYPNLIVGNEVWQIPVLLFAILFPALLFFDFVSRKYLRHSYCRRALVLIVLFVLSELEFYSIPFGISQVKIELNLLLVLILLSFTIIAAALVIQIMKLKNDLVIIQKEI